VSHVIVNNINGFRGHVDKVTRRVVSGWATQGPASAPVNIYINGQFAGTAQSSVTRSDVAGTFGTDPVCGFSFEFLQQDDAGIFPRSLEPGDIVSVHFINGEHLVGSPWAPYQQTKFNFGDFGLQPATNDWGFSRGDAIDRYYIEAFLDRHSYDIRGRVLEVGGNVYTQRYGGSRVSQSDVLDVAQYNSAVTIVADLTDALNIPSETFDCVVLTHVLPLVREAPKAISTVCRILKQGGVALITVPGISQISSYKNEAANWSWSFYPDSLRWLLEQADFDRSRLLIEAWGNCKTTVSFLAGLAQDDLEPADFQVHDPRYPLTVTARAVKRI
jgi:SAM-dependent methyltransferase